MDELLISDDQSCDWYGWITNQGGHAYFVGVPLGSLAAFWGLGWIYALVVVFVAYFLVWDFLIQNQGNLRDSLNDSFFVASSAGALVALINTQWVTAICVFCV